MPKAADKFWPTSDEHPSDVLSARLDQCGAILCVIDHGFDDDQADYIIPGLQLRAALNGVFDLLAEARRMADRDSDMRRRAEVVNFERKSK